MQDLSLNPRQEMLTSELWQCDFSYWFCSVTVKINRMCFTNRYSYIYFSVNINFWSHALILALHPAMCKQQESRAKKPAF